MVRNPRHPQQHPEALVEMHAPTATLWSAVTQAEHGAHTHTHTPHGRAARGNARQNRHDEAPTTPSIAIGMSLVSWAPHLCPVTPMCAPQPCHPHPGPDQHAAAALPGPKGCQEAWLQAAEARWREFLDVHHSKPRSWIDPSCPTSSGWGSGRGAGARWEGSRPPS